MTNGPLGIKSTFRLIFNWTYLYSVILSPFSKATSLSRLACDLLLSPRGELVDFTIAVVGLLVPEPYGSAGKFRCAMLGWV